MDLEINSKNYGTASINNNIVNNNFYINLGSLNSLELNLDKNMLETINTNRDLISKLKKKISKAVR